VSTFGGHRRARVVVKIDAGKWKFAGD